MDFGQISKTIQDAHNLEISQANDRSTYQPNVTLLHKSVDSFARWLGLKVVNTTEEIENRIFRQAHWNLVGYHKTKSLLLRVVISIIHMAGDVLFQALSGEDLFNEHMAFLDSFALRWKMCPRGVCGFHDSVSWR